MRGMRQERLVRIRVLLPWNAVFKEDETSQIPTMSASCHTQLFPLLLHIQPNVHAFLILLPLSHISLHSCTFGIFPAYFSDLRSSMISTVKLSVVPRSVSSTLSQVFMNHTNTYFVINFSYCPGIICKSSFQKINPKRERTVP